MTSLADAIARIVAQQRATAPSAMPREELKECAHQARRLITLARSALAEVTFHAHDRGRTAVPLLLAAMDQAWAFSHLLATEPELGQFGAVSLYRSLTETLLRGAFFAKPATDDEIQYFRTKDLMPQRAPMRAKFGSKKTKLSAGELAEIVDHAYAFEPRGRLVESVQADWNQWNGIVHGGVNVVGMYGGARFRGSDGMHLPMGWHSQNEGMQELVSHAAVFAWLALLAATEVAHTLPDEARDAIKYTEQQYQGFALRWPPPLA
ncbi:hypothetical protein [Stenotrophomonas maltophilia]|jgi:hypothetical protein|uniref:hypothetical protein n=1 Tax=Stenotrophomonas maltophilia TaxID=40324 RepID=UPI000D19ECAC|nr:hypothetical protein [Stenotrophomonas maltophilia]MBN5031197.1 hypothetical protein [Stenotrophomonas maltophilia]MCI1151601.1 hypothetical protein [Stenotrophomonas maltophilia]